MLVPYRRHSKDCPHRSKGRKWNRCKCPIWGQDGRKVKESLNTRDWTIATETCRKYDANGGRFQAKVESGDVMDSIEKFRAEMDGRRLRPSTKRQYNSFLSKFVKFCAERGVSHLSQFNLLLAEQLRQSWRDHTPLSAQSQLKRLRMVFRYFVDHEWMTTNWGKKLRFPSVQQSPTLPFTVEEMRQILTAIDQYGLKRSRARLRLKRLRVLCLVMRYSGLRIGDASTLSCDRMDDNLRMFLYTQKTGTPVHCKLPEFVAEQLRALPPKSSRYWFWTGMESMEAVSGNYRTLLHRATKEAGMNDIHPHRFRDTFAVELLLAGVPMERVSILLGHSSLKITEKHYAPWVHARQAQLEQDLDRVNASDPLAKDAQPTKLQRVK